MVFTIADDISTLTAYLIGYLENCRGYLNNYPSFY
jgi:hypothetical protein